MTPRATWDSSEGGVYRGTAVTGEAGAVSKNLLTLLHVCLAPMALPPPPRCRRAPVSPGPACIALVLLLCSLVQQPVASLQLPRPPSSPATAWLPPRLLDGSTTFTQQSSLTNTVPPQTLKAPRGRRVSIAGKRYQNPLGAVTFTHAAKAPPYRHAHEGPPRTHARATRSVQKIRRVEMQGPTLRDRRTLYVEAVVLADYSLYSHYGTQTNVLQRITQVLSVANKLLGGVGVVLVPSEVLVLNGKEEFRVNSVMETTLYNLRQYRLNLLQRYSDMPNDHTILLTRMKMRGRNSCGSPLRGMCKKKQSLSVVQDEGEGPAVTGVALAHQVGHNLGMEDDAEDADNACRCEASTCVMSRHFRNASTLRLGWSSCSKKSFYSVSETLALDCLRNVPTRMHLSPSCGDGVVDDGEQCDCGHPEYCDNPCCVAATCKLAVNASCASGSCCNTQTCQPKPPGTMCRAAFTECDLPEFCSGHSEYCPKDATKADGATCRGEQGHCFGGECGSREERCERVWGPSATVASPECYFEFNVQGDQARNCGFQSGDYRRCRSEESLCGTLHCLPLAPSLPLLQEHRNGSRRTGPHECHFISASGDYPAQHWLTPNGASCGPGKMCVNQECMEVQAPSGDCRKGCSGRGVCNNLGHCHCHPGYSPPDCSLPGMGGSVDSNVMSDVSDPRVLITSMLMLPVLLLGLLAVTCCSWGCFKGWYKQKGRAHISRIHPCCASCLDTCCCPVMTKAARWMVTVGSSPEKKQSHRNFEVEESVNEQMLCSVDVDIKGSSQTNSWGVANEKLVTEVVTITPGNSPDLRRKVKLPLDSPVLHHKSHDNLQRPKYLQSISTDSGCVSDTDEDSSKRSSLQLSMSSLISTLRKFGNKKCIRTPETPEREISLSKNSSSQKTIPLSRLVVDPLAGGRGSRQATPPPKQVRPAYCRSFSTDIISTGPVRAEGTPPPLPSSALKPNKSEENLSMTSEMPNCVRLSSMQNSSPANSTVQVSHKDHKDGVRDAAATSTRKTPLLPPKKPLPSPPKTMSQRGHDRKIQGKPSPPRETPSSSPAINTSSGAQKSSPGTAASITKNKVMEMARKFDAA